MIDNRDSLIITDKVMPAFNIILRFQLHQDAKIGLKF